MKFPSQVLNCRFVFCFVCFPLCSPCPCPLLHPALRLCPPSPHSLTLHLLPLSRRKAHRARFRVDFIVVFAAAETSAAATANLAIPSRRRHSPRPAQQVPSPTAIANRKTVPGPPSLSVGPAHKFPLRSAPNTATLSCVPFQSPTQIRGLGHIGPDPSAPALGKSGLAGRGQP